MSIVCLVPGFYGSPEVRLRNFRTLNGQPIIAYTIKVALETGFERVIFSADDQSVANVGTSYGAECPFVRPSSLVGERNPSFRIARHMLDWLRDNENYTPSAVCYLRPTSLFRSAIRLREAISVYESQPLSVASVSPVVQHPYYMMASDAAGKLREYLQMKRKPERWQDLPALYCLNSYVTITETSFFQSPANDTGPAIDLKKFEPFHVSQTEGFEIKSDLDIQLAEMMMQKADSLETPERFEVAV